MKINIGSYIPKTSEKIMLNKLLPILALFISISTYAAAPSLDSQGQALTPGTWGILQVDNPLNSVPGPINVDPDLQPQTNAPCAAAGKVYPCGGKVSNYRGASGFNSLFGAWNSAAYVPELGTCGSILYTGGGHTDYYGSEVIRFGLCDGVNGGPIWSRFTDPYNPTSALVWPYPNGLFPDGSPNPTHTYDGIVYAAGKLIKIESADCYNQGSCGTYNEYGHHAYMLDIASKTWVGPYAHLGGQQSSSAYDPDHGVVWFQPNSAYGGQFASLDPNTGTVISYGVPNKSNLDQMMGYDKVNHVLVNAILRATPWAVYEMNPSVPNGTTWAAVTQINKPVSTKMRGAHTFAWSEDRGAFIVYFGIPSNAEVWEFKRTGVKIWTWTLLTDPSNTVIPVNATINGMYKKMQVVKVGYHEYLMGIVTVPVGTFIFRLPDVIPLAKLSCKDPGIIICDTFDSAAIFNTGITGNLIAGYNGVKPQQINGMLEFDIPSIAGQDTAGRKEYAFPAMGAGSTVEFSYDIYADDGAVNYPSNTPGRKEFTIWAGTSPCTTFELTQTHATWYPSQLLSPYTACGNGHLGIPIGTAGDILTHYPDFDCHYLKYRLGDVSGCAVSEVSKWQYYYVKIKIGTLGQPNTYIALWQRNTGGTWKRYIERSDWTFTGSGGLNHFMFTTYQTSRDATISYNPGTVLIDNFILKYTP